MATHKEDASPDVGEFIQRKQQVGLAFLRFVMALLLSASAGGLGAGAFYTVRCGSHTQTLARVGAHVEARGPTHTT